MIRPSFRVWILALLSLPALGLSGCGGDPDRVWAQAFGYQCSNHSGAEADAVCNTRPPGEKQETVSRYCYKTLADANCFDRPDEMSKNQELGSSGK